MPTIIEEPQKLTQEVRAKLEEAAALDCTWEEMAFFAGISKSSLYNWLASVDGLKDRLHDLKQSPVLKARRTVVGALDQPGMALSYLERKRRSEFATRQEQTGADGRDLYDPLAKKIADLGESLRNPHADEPEQEHAGAERAGAADAGADGAGDVPAAPDAGPEA